MSIESLDAKCSIHILPSNYTNNTHVPNDAVCKPYAGGTLWEIDNFLTSFEANEILQSCTNHYEYLQYRNSYRCIAIDSNQVLSNLISKRLSQNNFLSKLNGYDWQQPRGFNDPNIEWLPNDGTINSCIRINKYVNGQFDYHRDAPLTCNSQLKSNYTLIVYLNTQHDEGYTQFLLPTIKYDHNGLSIKEELALIGDQYNTIRIKPTLGKAIIFDHGLIHKSTHTDKTKYVLRTDLLCKGINTKKLFTSSILYKSLEDLTCKLFRQAQLNELEGISSGDLYERCLNLRMCPDELTKFPEHLLQFIIPTSFNKSIISSLRLVSRDSSVYTFDYNTLIDNKFSIVRTAVLFALNTLTVDITNQVIAKFNDSMINVQVNDQYEQRNNIVKPRIQKLIDKKQEILGRSIGTISKNSSKKLTRINNELDSQQIVTISNKTYFSDSMGKYNMLEDIPEHFIRGLANVVRIRSNGAGRSAFDLTNSVLIDDLKFKRMASSKVSFKDGDTRFSDLPLNFVQKDFDSSLYETIKRLFGELNLKFDSQHIRSLEFDEIGKITDNFSAHTVIQLIGKQYKLKIQKTMYSYYDRNYYDTQNINNPDAFCFHSFKFATTIGETGLNFHNVVFYEGTIIGDVTIDSPTRYFNHAACQSDVVDTYVREVKEVSNNTTMKYIILKHDAQFIMTSNKLTITIIPHIVL